MVHDVDEELAALASFPNRLMPGQRILMALSDDGEIGFIRRDDHRGEIIEQAYFDSRDELAAARAILEAATERGELQQRTPTVWTWPGDDAAKLQGR